MQTDHDQRPFATGSGARPSGLRERIEAAAALHDDGNETAADERPDTDTADADARSD
jgi:hypothetical protein